MSEPQQLQDRVTTESPGDVLRVLTSRVAYLEDQLRAAHEMLRSAGLLSGEIGGQDPGQVGQVRLSLAASEAANAALLQTNQELAEESCFLRASEGQLVRLIDTAPVAIMETDTAGSFLYANAAAEEILGITRRGVEGRRSNVTDWWLRWPDGRVIELRDRPIARALRGESVTDMEVKLARASDVDPSLMLRVGAVPVRGSSGQVEGALATFVDVTARHAARAQLHASEERARLAFEIAGACAWELDPGSGLSSWDTAARSLLGLPGVLPFTEAANTFVHEDDRGEVHAAVASALDPAGDGRYALKHRAAEGLSLMGTHWLQSLGQAYFQEDGTARRAFRLVCVTSDVTDRRAAEERQSLLLAELNHRVKNTLAVVQALAEQTRRVTDKRFPDLTCPP